MKSESSEIQVSLWSRNVQLAAWSIVTGGAALLMSGDGTKIREGGVFKGYTPVVWLVVLLQGATGILVALVMKYADNIVSTSLCMSVFDMWWMICR